MRGPVRLFRRRALRDLLRSLRRRALIAGIALVSAAILPMLSAVQGEAAIGGRWDQLNLSVSPPGDSPGIRSAYDPVRQEVVSVACCPTSTWVFNGASWTDTHATTPVPGVTPYMDSVFMSLVWYPPTAKVVMIITAAGCSQQQPYCFDTWTWDGQAWVRQATLTQPYCLSTELAYDSGRNRLFAYGMCPGSNVDATWSYDGTGRWLRVVSAASTAPLEFSAFSPSPTTRLANSSSLSVRQAVGIRAVKRPGSGMASAGVRRISETRTSTRGSWPGMEQSCD